MAKLYLNPLTLVKNTYIFHKYAGTWKGMYLAGKCVCLTYCIEYVEKKNFNKLLVYIEHTCPVKKIVLLPHNARFNVGVNEI